MSDATEAWEKWAETESWAASTRGAYTSFLAGFAAGQVAAADENANLLAQVERLQARLLKAEEPRPNQPIDDFGGNIRSMYIRVSDGWLRRFDKWRKAKGLSRSGAIRKLVQDAWEGEQ